MNKITKCGTDPGTLLYTGNKIIENPTISVIDYNGRDLHEIEIEDVNELASYRNQDSVTWINVEGLYNVGIIEQIGNIFGIHPLAMEDILNINQRSKVDFYDRYIYIVLRMLNYNEILDMFEAEQISIILGNGFLISFQEEPGDSFNPVRERIRKHGKIVERGADFLAYSLLDIIIDGYFVALERMGEWIETLEGDILQKPSNKRTLEISDLKRDAIFLRRNIWPVREVVHTLTRNDEALIASETRFFINDLYDHVVQVIDNLENDRDMIGALMELYLSNISNRMNEIMKTLTMIATIFIPITFITSLYGMNFKYMPELDYKYSYPIVLGVILLISVVMIMYFRKKKWL
jgi:magnesium transporter